MCRSEPYVAVPKILAQVSTEMNRERISMAIGSTQWTSTQGDVITNEDIDEPSSDRITPKQ